MSLERTNSPQPQDDAQASRNEPSNVGLIAEAARSALYAATMEPVRGVAQLVDHRWGTNLDANIRSGLNNVGLLPQQHAEFGTATWAAHQLGSAAGMMVPFKILQSGVRGALSTFGHEAAASQTFFRTAAHEALVSGAAGSIYGLALRPSNEQNIGTSAFVTDRLRGSVTDAASFAALGFINPYTARLLGVSNPILPGFFSGAPAGVVNAEIGALADGRLAPTQQELNESVVGMMMVGGAFGAAHSFGARARAENAITERAAAGTIGGAEPQRRFAAATETSEELDASNRPVIGRAARRPRDVSAEERDAMQFRPQEDVPLRELTARLPEPREGEYDAELLPRQLQPFETYKEFSEQLVFEKRPAMIYQLGETELVVPLNYYRALEELRTLRTEAERGGPDGALARVELMDHPLRNRILPEELLPVLDRLPNRSIFKRIELLDNELAQDEYSRQRDQWVIANYNDKGVRFEASASVDSDGKTLGIYRGGETTRSARERFMELLKHEQVHSNHEQGFGIARNMDKPIEASRYGYRDKYESEAELEALHFLSPDAKYFFSAVREAPARMATIAAKLRRTLETTPVEQRSLDEHEIMARVRYIERSTTPKVIEGLAASISAETARTAAREPRGWSAVTVTSPEGKVETLTAEGVLAQLKAPETLAKVQLLARLNGARQNRVVQDTLLDVVRNSQDPQLYKEAAHQIGLIGDTADISALHDVIRYNNAGSRKQTAVIDALLYIDTAGDTVSKLIRWSQPDSPISAAARDKLRHMDPNWTNRPFADELLMTPPENPAATLLERSRYSVLNGDRTQQLIAAKRLGKLGDETDVPALYDLATNERGNNTGVAALAAVFRLSNGGKDPAVSDVSAMALRESPLKETGQQLLRNWREHFEPNPRATLIADGVLYDIDRVHVFYPENAARHLRYLPAGNERRAWMNAVMRAVGEQTEFSNKNDATTNQRDFLAAILKDPELADLHDGVRPQLERLRPVWVPPLPANDNYSPEPLT